METFKKIQKIQQKVIPMVSRNKYAYKLARFIGNEIYNLYYLIIFPKHFIIKDFNKDFKLINLKKTGEKFLVRKKNLRNDISTIYEIFVIEAYKTDFLDYIDKIRGEIVIDIGAYIGDTSVFFGKKDAVIYAYEPSKELYEIAKKNIELNNIDNIKIFNVGIGDVNKNLKMALNKKNQSDAGNFIIFDEFRSLNMTKKDRFLFTEEVKIISLNEVLNKFESVYLLKMDCEGCEFPAIISVKNENLQKIKYIIMEIHFLQLFDLNVIFEKLKNNNFEVFIKKIELGNYGMLYGRSLS